MIAPEVLLALLGLFVGLWWGEMGRRRDAQVHAGLRRRGSKPRDVDEPAEPTHEPLFTSDERRDAIGMIMAEAGVDDQEAAQELDRLTAAAFGGRVTS